MPDLISFSPWFFILFVLLQNISIGMTQKNTIDYKLFSSIMKFKQLFTAALIALIVFAISKLPKTGEDDKTLHLGQTLKRLGTNSALQAVSS